jgi:8-oxo-dGTP pyrophosphatase MutT (NUDIX family)
MNCNWYPHLTVATIVERSGKYLIVEELSDGIKVFNQPAGHLEQNETLVEAAVRETLEETGWHVKVDALVGFFMHTSGANNITYFRCCFIATALEHDKNYSLDEGIIGPVWLTLDQLKQHKHKLRSPLVLQCIEDYEAGKRFSLDSISHS